MKNIFTTLLAISLLLISEKALAQCAVRIAGDTLVCVGDETILSANVTGPANNLQASNTGGNNHRGNMFDIVATNAVTILSFEASPMGNTTIEIYYKVGTWNGFANTPSAWTFVGSAPVIYTGGFSFVDVPVNVTIPAGETYAFYVTSNTSSVSLNYSNGTNVGNVYASDANITFLEGGGMEYPFTQNTGAVYQPRVWNGRIHYALHNTAGTTFSWSTTESTSSIDETINAQTEYYVESTTPGCPTMFDTVDVWVSIPPVSAGLDQSHCLGDSMILFGTGAESYNWDQSITDSLYFTPTSAGTTTYIVTGTDSIGCVLNDTVSVTVHTLPLVSAGTDFAVCLGDTVLLAGDGATNYTWDGGVTDDTGFVPATTDDYIVDGLDANGCHNVDTITVTVNSIPVVSAGTDIETCSGAHTTLSGSGADTYLWNNGITNGVVFSAPEGITEYVVKGTDVNGCFDMDTMIITANGIEAQIFLVGTTLVGTSISSTTTLQWYNCSTGQIIAGEEDHYYTPVATGNYAVIATSDEGCKDTSACILIDFTSISENNAGSFEVYPNPTAGSVKVRSSETIIDKIQVFDLIGRLLFEEESNVLETSVDLSDFEGKQFFLVIHRQNNTEMVKVLKY